MTPSPRQDQVLSRERLKDLVDRVSLGHVDGDEAALADLSFAVQRFLPVFRKKFDLASRLCLAERQWLASRDDHNDVTACLMHRFEAEIVVIAKEDESSVLAPNCMKRQAHGDQCRS